MPLVKRWGGGVQRIKSTNQMCTIVTSYQEAKSGLQDILHFLETKASMKTANELPKAIANAQSD